MNGEQDFPMSEASLYERDLYVEITMAWYQIQPHGLGIDSPFRPYILGAGFANSVSANEAYVELGRVAAICALVISSHPWQLNGLRKVLDTQNIGRVPKTSLDPLCAWWYPLGKPYILGIHYWELGSGTIELRCLNRFEKPPPIRLGRVAAEQVDGGAESNHV
jgi:hypothetical protein